MIKNKIGHKMLQEWHLEKNKKLKPENFSAYSHRKAWWKCSQNHEWQASFKDRTYGNSCPYCSNKKVCLDNCLATVNNELAKEWHCEKNYPLTPFDVVPGSKRKVWWACSKNNGHEWKATVTDRNRGSKCPFCSGKKASPEYSLAIISPQLLVEWSSKNIISPFEVTPGSNKKVWWICKHGHQWEEMIYRRTIGFGCPICSGRKVSVENCLLTINPKLADEWDISKNYPLLPSAYTANSNKKVWWLCKNGHGWQANIKSRNKGSGCPKCKSKTSVMELAIYSELTYFFDYIIHRYKHAGMEVDIFLPELNIGIEYDGRGWHKNTKKNDLKKNFALSKDGILLIRIREKGLPLLANQDFILPKDYSFPKFEIMAEIVKHIFKYIHMDKVLYAKLKTYNENKKLINLELLYKLLDMLPGPLPGKSLYETDKKVSIEWHPTLNGNITPNNISSGSSLKFWWLCEQGHVWQEGVYQRSKTGYGCPFCSGKRVSPENNFEALFPKIAKEWNYNKNYALLPRNVTAFSSKKVWWICSNGHEWVAPVSRRALGFGCPFCSGRKPSDTNNLLFVNPPLAEEWDVEKNYPLAPKDVTPFSHKIIWWKCKKEHAWQAKVQSRSNGHNCCPICFKLR